MKALLRSTTLCAVLAAFGLGFGLTGQISSQAYGKGNKNAEEQAAATLAKLNVPLQKDVRGSVRWIEAAEGELTDEAMRCLPDLSHLEWLEIGGGNVTTSGIANLKNCKALKRLYIHDIDLAGDSLEWLAGLTRLEALSLQHTGIDGKFLKNLKATETLAVLNLSGDPIVDDDLGKVARLKGLEVLALADTRITGTGIVELEGMASLNELNVMNCPISDADISPFLTMPNLRIVYAEGCNLSDAAIWDMKARFPMLAIFR